MTMLRWTLIFTLLVTSLGVMASGTRKAKYEIQLKNLTKGQILSKPVLLFHRKNYDLFKEGEVASLGLQQLAEDGLTEELAKELRTDSVQVEKFHVSEEHLDVNGTLTFVLETRAPGFVELSLVTMLATTNDAVSALLGARLPRSGSKTYTSTEYDAGTEANNELCATIPGPPCGNVGVRDQARSEGKIGLFQGIKGVGDLDPEEFGLSGPALEITVKKIR